MIKKNNIYYGGVEKPKYLDELTVDIFEDECFDDENDDLVESGKLQVVLGGTNKAIEEFGKYLITVARFDTKDPDYHDHFDNIEDYDGEDRVNLIVKKEH